MIFKRKFDKKSTSVSTANAKLKISWNFNFFGSQKNKFKIWGTQNLVFADKLWNFRFLVILFIINITAFKWSNYNRFFCIILFNQLEIFLYFDIKICCKKMNFCDLPRQTWLRTHGEWGPPVPSTWLVCFRCHPDNGSPWGRDLWLGRCQRFVSSNCCQLCENKKNPH